MPESTDLLTPVSESDHTQGPADAPVTLVEYGDYECPDCLNSEPIIRQLREKFGDKLRIVFRHYPQHSIHPHASAAAQAAEAAAAQGKFWEMHQALFARQRDLADLDFTHLALQLGMDPYRFQRDSEVSSVTRRVRDHHKSGEQSGVHGTPTFFINGCRHRGRADLETLSKQIDNALPNQQ
jgi:NhaA family Na+:H+ antiporter